MLEPGEVTGIVNAITDQMSPVVGELDSRLTAVELRIANIEPRIAGQVGAQMQPRSEDPVDMARVEALEAAVGEMYGAMTELRDAYNSMAGVVQSQSVALLKVLAGEGDEGVWRDFVVREAVGAGVGVKDYAAVVREMKPPEPEVEG
jgi:hypothetical protein